MSTVTANGMNFDIAALTRCAISQGPDTHTAIATLTQICTNSNPQARSDAIRDAIARNIDASQFKRIAEQIQRRGDKLTDQSMFQIAQVMGSTKKQNFFMESTETAKRLAMAIMVYAAEDAGMAPATIFQGNNLELLFDKLFEKLYDRPNTLVRIQNSAQHFLVVSMDLENTRAEKKLITRRTEYILAQTIETLSIAIAPAVIGNIITCMETTHWSCVSGIDSAIHAYASAIKKELAAKAPTPSAAATATTPSATNIEDHAEYAKRIRPAAEFCAGAFNEVTNRIGVALAKTYTACQARVSDEHVKEDYEAMRTGSYQHGFNKAIMLTAVHDIVSAYAQVNAENETRKRTAAVSAIGSKLMGAAHLAKLSSIAPAKAGLLGFGAKEAELKNKLAELTMERITATSTADQLQKAYSNMTAVMTALSAGFMTHGVIKKEMDNMIAAHGPSAPEEELTICARTAMQLLGEYENLLQEKDDTIDYMFKTIQNVDTGIERRYKEQIDAAAAEPALDDKIKFLHNATGKTIDALSEWIADCDSAYAEIQALIDAAAQSDTMIKGLMDSVAETDLLLKLKAQVRTALTALAGAHKAHGAREQSISSLITAMKTITPPSVVNQVEKDFNDPIEQAAAYFKQLSLAYTALCTEARTVADSVITPTHAFHGQVQAKAAVIGDPLAAAKEALRLLAAHAPPPAASGGTVDPAAPLRAKLDALEASIKASLDGAMAAHKLDGFKTEVDSADCATNKLAGYEKLVERMAAEHAATDALMQSLVAAAGDVTDNDSDVLTALNNAMPETADNERQRAVKLIEVLHSELENAQITAELDMKQCFYDACSAIEKNVPPDSIACTSIVQLKKNPTPNDPWSADIVKAATIIAEQYGKFHGGISKWALNVAGKVDEIIQCDEDMVNAFKKQKQDVTDPSAYTLIKMGLDVIHDKHAPTLDLGDGTADGGTPLAPGPAAGPSAAAAGTAGAAAGGAAAGAAIADPARKYMDKLGLNDEWMKKVHEELKEAGATEIRNAFNDPGSIHAFNAMDEAFRKDAQNVTRTRVIVYLIAASHEKQAEIQNEMKVNGIASVCEVVGYLNDHAKKINAEIKGNSITHPLRALTILLAEDSKIPDWPTLPATEGLNPIWFGRIFVNADTFLSNKNDPSGKQFTMLFGIEHCRKIANKIVEISGSIIQHRSLADKPTNEQLINLGTAIEDRANDKNSARYLEPDGKEKDSALRGLMVDLRKMFGARVPTT